jgi:outer membrane biosynthesis protein TonB
MRGRSVLIPFALLAACRPSQDPEVAPEPETRSASIASAGLKHGDCPEALRRAADKPDLDVDRLPAPAIQKPAPLQRVPLSALRRDGSAEVKVDVIIDTLGKADMTTFRIVKSSSPWLANNVRRVIGQWTFAPAELAGCKVPRVYHFMASTPARAQSR